MVFAGTAQTVKNLLAGELHHAFRAAQECDVLFAIGTSGLLRPAARIPSLAKQARTSVVQINPTRTSLDNKCTWSLRAAAGDILPRLLQAACTLHL